MKKKNYESYLLFRSLKYYCSLINIVKLSKTTTVNGNLLLMGKGKVSRHRIYLEPLVESARGERLN